VFDIIDTISDENLLGVFFTGPSWSNWRLVLKAMHGLRMTPAERLRFRELADRDPPPGRVREAWLAIGRRGGKDSIASAIAVHAAVYGDFSPYTRPGERPVVLLLAGTKEQASGLFDYVAAYFDGRVPLLAPLVRKVNDRDGIIELTTGVDIAVMAVAQSPWRSLTRSASGATSRAASRTPMPKSTAPSCPRWSRCARRARC
jgi:hypothetical protein